MNDDGVRGTGEMGMAGWRIFLDTNGNGMLDTGELSTLTSSTGQFTFTGLPAGNYSVREMMPSGWRRTTYFADFSLAAGATASGKDFGDTQKALFSGYVYNDLNKNGSRDATDTAAVRRDGLPGHEQQRYPGRRRSVGQD